MLNFSAKPTTCQQLKESFGDIEAMLYDSSGEKTINCCRRLFNFYFLLILINLFFICL